MSYTLRKNSRGFTLIELLVTIAIIGIISAVIFALLTGTRNKGKDAKVKAEVTQIKTAVEGYAATNGGYPYADTGEPGGTMWCIGDDDCKLAGQSVSNNTYGSAYWTGDKDMFPQYPNSDEFKDGSERINKGYIYVSCTSGEAQNGVCPLGTAHIIYPLTGSSETITLNGGGNGSGGSGGGGGGTITFDGGGDGSSWNNPANWNPDGVPGASNTAVIPNGFNVTDDATDPVAGLIVNGSSVINGVVTVTGSAVFNDTSANNGTVDGNAVFNDGSNQAGSVSSGSLATFNDYSQNTGWVYASSIFNNTSHNESVVEGSVTFNDASRNNGTFYDNTFTSAVDAFFRGTSVNSGSVYADACFSPSASNEGTVTGNISVCN